MNTKTLLPHLRRAALLAAWTGSLLAVPAALAAEKHENYIEFSAGYAKQSGDRPGFQRDRQISKDGYGGIEELFVTKSLNDDTTLVLKGRALAGNNDWLLDVAITKDEVGYLKFGYKEFRVWFDGTGGFHPANGFNAKLFDEDLSLDRGNLWFEAGYVPEDKLNFVFRYDLFTRQGTKDSTSWGDTALAINAANTRGLLPSFHRIDEKRHQVSATLSKKEDGARWELGVRADQGDYTNSRNETRRAGEAGLDRKITHKEGRDYDLFMVRGSYVNKVHEKLMVTTAVARTKIDTTISGTRIYGTDYDPVYDPGFATRQQRDEGFFDLHGRTEMKQTVGTISALYQPDENWSIVPSLRFEEIDWFSVAGFVETNFTSARLPDNTELESESDKSWKNISESVEARYRGLKNVSLKFSAEWVQADGDLRELEVDEPGTPAQAVTIDRDTEFERRSQKYAASANWYFAPGATLAVQYYHKARQNDYRSPRDSTAAVTAAGLPSGDRYPANIANQDFATDDFNVRLSWRMAAKLRSITRYDYQKSTIMTQDVGGAFGRGAAMDSRIISQTLAFNPLARWFVQGTVNHVRDELTTPAVNATGAAAGRVTASNVNYWNWTLGTGYALDEGSDLYADYSLYRAFNDYFDNSATSVAFGTKARTQQLGVTWFRRFGDRTALTVRYAYAESKDSAVGTLADYEAHLVYAKVQYRF